jgi:hypothetical protein
MTGLACDGLQHVYEHDLPNDDCRCDLSFAAGRDRIDYATCLTAAFPFRQLNWTCMHILELYQEKCAYQRMSSEHQWQHRFAGWGIALTHSSHHRCAAACTPAALLLPLSSAASPNQREMIQFACTLRHIFSRLIRFISKTTAARTHIFICW